MNRLNIQQRAMSIVGELLELASEDRASVLSARCDGDIELMSEVKSLLAASERLATRHPLSEQRIDQQRADAERALNGTESGPTSIGSFRVVRELGRGGMSVVYECEQETPHRRVAVKLMDSRLSGPAMNRRLRLEAEILGRLRHECIATIHEAGVTPKGEGSRPYFAMELVEGLPLTEFAEHGSLDTRARLQLLARVADGVEHAHQKGVIHRDLKPGNILVTPAGVPKILDFGIARVTDSDINTTTMHTSAGAILGTLAYMSPEQASADPAAVDTRSDVYSLGVLAFELLSGKLPHAVDDTPIHEAIRIIREDQPTLIATLDTSLRGDVDTIIAKALEQDADRRYASAAALADDIRRYLIDQPIMARPPSTLYRLQKFVRRNHALVGGGVATLTVLILGVVVSSLLAISERDARLAAQQQERLAQEREVVAISSVLSGASALRDADRPWEARRQLSGIDPDSRGWEWRHIALDLPWVIDIGNIRRIRDQAAATRFVTFSGDSSLVFESFRPESAVWTVDLRTEVWSRVPHAGGVRNALRTAQPTGRVGVLTKDNRIGAVDLLTGAFDEWMPGTDFDVWHGIWNAIYADPTSRAIVIIEEGELRIYEQGREVFRAQARSVPESSRHWGPPRFSPDSRYVYLSESSSPGYLRTLETDTWTEVASVRTPTADPEAFLSHDGATLFVDSGREGLLRYTTPMLEPAGTVAPELGPVTGATSTSAGELLVLATDQPGVIHLYDTAANATLSSIPLHATRLLVDPIVSSDNRIATIPLPSEEGVWVLDLTMPVDPSRTLLEGHASWVYQLAMSPDGSLLASAEPVGDILLWDLRADRLLARLPRRSGASNGLLLHNMDTPLVFTNDGRSLVFGELHESLTPGLTVINLESGRRRWADTGSHEATLDAVAAMLPAGTPAPLYHHAALLGNGKLVHSHSGVINGRSVVVRDPASAADSVRIETGTHTRSGVAAHPNRSQYASGEYRQIRIRDAETNAVLHEISDGSSSIVYGLAYSPDGSRLAMATEDGRVLIMETQFYTRIAQFRIPPKADPSERNYVFNLVWTPDGSRLITTGTNRLLIFETERPFVREHKRAEWTQDLDRARQGSDASEAARRVAAIERWASEGDRSEQPKDLVPASDPQS